LKIFRSIYETITFNFFVLLGLGILIPPLAPILFEILAPLGIVILFLKILGH